MRFLVAMISVLPIITWMITYKKKLDICSPYNLFTFLYVINKMLPNILYASRITSGTISVPYLRDVVLNDSIYIEYTVLQTLCYYAVVFGMKIKVNNFSVNKKVISDNQGEICSNSNRKYGYYKYMGIALWIIGTIAFMLIMKKVGGVMYFFTHLQYRTSIMRNIDMLSWILPFVNYGTLFIVYSLRDTNKKIDIKIVILIVLSGIMSGLGGRKALLILLIETIILYHYTVKRINIKKFLNLKYLFIAVAIYIFFIVMPKFRTEGAFETFMSDPIQFIINSNNGLLNTIRRESYVTYYMAIIKYFKTNMFWLGKSFLGLVTAIIPSSLLASKAPVDDGTYLYSICQGRTDIIPPMSFSELNGSSFPLETFGSMYANFGIIGLFLGMMLLGMIYKISYRRMITSYSLFSVVMYTQIMFTFELSTLRIFQIFEFAVIFGVITHFSKYHLWLRRR